MRLSIPDPRRVHPVWLLLIPLALQVALQWRHLDRPPGGYHLWRQTQTLSVARNFHREGMNPLLPRVDSRGAGTGVTGMELPLVNYSIALAYRAFGERDVAHRLVLLGFGLLAIIGCFAWARGLLGSEVAGLTAALCLVLSPLFDYYSIVALPDVPMLGFLFLGLLGVRRGAASGRPGPALLGLGALTVAALVKASALLAWPAALVPVLTRWRSLSVRWRAACGACLAGGLVATLAWYLYAARLVLIGGSREYVLRPTLPYPLETVPAALGKVLLGWLPEVYLSYPQFALFLVGLASLGGAAGRAAAPTLRVYAAGLAAFAVAFLPALAVHDYYMVVGLPALVLLTTLGALRLLEASRRRRAPALVLLALLVAALVVGPYRAQSRHPGRAPADDLATIGSHLEGTLPERRALVIAASDPSPSVYLYFMGRKGWTATADLTADRFREMADQGARYLISDSRTLEERAGIRSRLEPLSSHGRFRVFAIRGAASSPATP